jgi:hypothetical protein
MSSVEPDATEVVAKRGLSCVPLAIGLAIPFGILGWLVGAFLLSPSSAAPFIARLIASTIGAGIGWFVGASLGYLVKRASPPPGEIQAWVLRIVGVAVVLVGLWIAKGVAHGFRGDVVFDSLPSTPNDPELLRWGTAIRMSAALVAITFVVLAHRRVLRTVVAAVGGAAALVIVVALVAQFASLARGG